MPVSRKSGARWHKSSRSSNVANCLEVAFAGQAVGLRDSKCAAGPVLVLPAGSFACLLASFR
jgi:uncharacterized protein DUF397